MDSGGGVLGRLSRRTVRCLGQNTAAMAIRWSFSAQAVAPVWGTPRARSVGMRVLGMVGDGDGLCSAALSSGAAVRARVCCSFVLMRSPLARSLSPPAWVSSSFVCTERGRRHQRRSLPLHWCRYVDSAGGSGLTSQHFSAGPSLAQPWQRGRLQRPAAVLRQPLLSCFSVVAHRAGARVRGAALLHRLYSARALA
jgi:hypothetical protein